MGAAHLIRCRGTVSLGQYGEEERAVSEHNNINYPALIRKVLVKSMSLYCFLKTFSLG